MWSQDEKVVGDVGQSSFRGRLGWEPEPGDLRDKCNTK